MSRLSQIGCHLSLVKKFPQLMSQPPVACLGSYIAVLLLAVLTQASASQVVADEHGIDQTGNRMR
jgi:hypothetical protein